VRFRQSGGIAGQFKGCDLDVAELSASEGRTLARFAEKCGPISIRRRSDRVRDGFQFEIVITDKSDVRRFEFDEVAVPKECRDLVDFLRKRARFMAPD
jgi:hypothetical protein